MSPFRDARFGTTISDSFCEGSTQLNVPLLGRFDSDSSPGMGGDPPLKRIREFLRGCLQSHLILNFGCLLPITA
jgi:hypothetical protein